MKSRPTILLVHGLILSPLSMVPLGARLQQMGWKTAYFTYSSLLEPTARVQRRLVETLSRGPTYVVAQSLGGLMSLETLAQNPELPVSRVMCMGTPLRGSGAALALHRFPLASLGVGRSDGILRRGVTQWPRSLEVGMLAGKVPVGFGAMFAGFGGPMTTPSRSTKPMYRRWPSMRWSRHPIRACCWTPRLPRGWIGS